MDSRWTRLQTLAKHQHGHFSVQQALEVGLTRPAISYQLRNGRISNPERGVYRFSAYPATDNEHLAILMLWSQLDPSIAFSHETALAHYELDDVLPEKIYLTVPKSFRQTPREHIVLHRSQLQPDEVYRAGILQFTDPLRTLLDLLRAGYPTEQLHEAMRTAIDKGLLRKGNVNLQSERVARYAKLLPNSRQAEFRGRLAAITGG